MPMSLRSLATAALVSTLALSLTLVGCGKDSDDDPIGSASACDGPGDVRAGFRVIDFHSFRRQFEDPCQHDREWKTNGEHNQKNLLHPLG